MGSRRGRGLPAGASGGILAGSSGGEAALESGSLKLIICLEKGGKRRPAMGVDFESLSLALTQQDRREKRDQRGELRTVPWGTIRLCATLRGPFFGSFQARACPICPEGPRGPQLLPEPLIVPTYAGCGRWESSWSGGFKVLRLHPRMPFMGLARKGVGYRSHTKTVPFQATLHRGGRWQRAQRFGSPHLLGVRTLDVGAAGQAAKMGAPVKGHIWICCWEPSDM